ncbi:hypothetical protein [Neisseria iguanae]|uniref:hypothetical protein n=1 Tax=Neisseria iguanae TaxID=90242 RepID=UPI0014743A56|nr:hypothetical protein [Neisseria iguanae]
MSEFQEAIKPTNTPYDEWLSKKIERSRQSKTLTSEESRRLVRGMLKKAGLKK